MRDRRAEDCHDAVANKFVHMTFVAGDNFRQVAHATIHKTGDNFGIQLFAHGSKATDVREQHGDITAL